MIALCRARCIMVQLKTLRGADNVQNAQRAYRGHTIFHQQDVSQFATMLPPSIEDILAPICVLFIGSRKPSLEWIRQHAKPLVVRANVVRTALKWLIENNPLYATISLNHEVLDRIEREGGLPYDIQYAADHDTSSETVSGYSPQNIDDTIRDANMNMGSPREIPFENVVITDLDQSATPREMREAALKHLQSGKKFFMYGHAANPETEYRNPNLFPSLYPTLYPYGVGGFFSTYHKSTSPDFTARA
ncbi:hypothetical protein F5887DRAFT_910819 [Amanita rubescens]|nr:hypothetical protein F5887DRAFT_910819 [Amanita rubescens]